MVDKWLVRVQGEIVMPNENAAQGRANAIKNAFSAGPPADRADSVVTYEKIDVSPKTGDAETPIEGEERIEVE